MKSEVELLAKARIYEIAKQLNTTSKRLMEKLDEINIKVKNHMSLLRDEELEALYSHIGVVKRKQENEQGQENGNVEPKQTVKKEKSKGPRIIRKREIIVDTKEDEKANDRGIRQDKREKGSVNVTNSGSGLRQGFVYENNSYEKLLSEAHKINTKVSESNTKKEHTVEFVGEEKKKVSKDEEKEVTKKVHKEEIKETNKQAKTQETKEVKKLNNEERVVSNVKKENVNENKKNTNEKKQNTSERKQNVGERKHNMGEKKQREENADKSKSVKSKDMSQNNKRQTKGFDDARNKTNRNRSNNNVRSNFGRDGGNNSTYRDNRNKQPMVKTSTTQSKELAEKQAEIISKQERRETLAKTTEKERKREQKKETAERKVQNNKESKYDNTKKYIHAGKSGVSDILSDGYIIDEYYDDQSKFAKRGKLKPRQKEEQNKVEIPKAVVKNVIVGEFVTVKELAEAMKKTAAELIKKLMFMGMMVTVNSEIDYETAVLIGDEFDIKVEKEVVVNEEDILFKDDEVDDADKLQPRPPVVVVMGHVDHGKTSLLDAIRKTNVTTGEAGGITQHIGAHTVKINNKSITFLDTPGHEAFTAMRARGAEVTDIVVLVVAADDGVMPQTVEAINHAKAANVSIIVAINKIDKEGASPDRVKQELSEYGLIPEEWGGDTIFVEVSAKKNQGIENLLEMITLVSEMLELKANPDRKARGTIIEAKLDKDRGPIATLLVQEGTLNTGDSIVAGVTFGRIRAMVDDKGRRIKKAGPSTPVEILGLHEVPEAGEVFHSITDEKLAKSLIEKRKLKQRQKHLKTTAKVSLEELYSQIKAGNIKDLNLIVKADVQGSVEAVKQSLQKLTNEEVRINIIHGGVGAVTEQDVILAQVSNAIVIGFNVRPALNVSEIAKNAGVDIRLYRVIYNAIEDIEAAMKGMLDPTFKEVVLGHVEIRQIFKVSGVGTIGGAYVLDGKITRNSQVRIIRDGIVVNEGKLASLKRFKDDAKEVQQGFECGLSIESFNDIKEGDIVEAFEMEEVKRD